MKRNTLVYQTTLILSSAMLCGGPAFGQPGIINPATGQPAGPNARTSAISAATGAPGNLNMATGLPYPKPGDTSRAGALSAALQTATDVRQLVDNAQYEEALERCLAFHHQFKTGGALLPLVGTWVELGRRFPKAKTALVEIRNHDVHEFSAKRGYMELFMEVNSINAALGQQEATYDLFNSIRKSDAALAQQCYLMAESLLVAKGEYEYCYDHIGDAQERFSFIRRAMTSQIENAKASGARMAETHQRLAEIHQRHGLTNMPTISPADTWGRMQRTAEVGFINNSRQLIEILVATGHKEEAKKIQAEAVAALDDVRLKTAVADAEAKIKK